MLEESQWVTVDKLISFREEGTISPDQEIPLQSIGFIQMRQEKGNVRLMPGGVTIPLGEEFTSLWRRLGNAEKLLGKVRELKSGRVYFFNRILKKKN